MNPGLLESLLEALPASAQERLAARVGADEAAVRAALPQAWAALLGAQVARANEAGRAADLFALLKDPRIEPALLEDPATPLDEGAPADALAALGARLSAFAFGDRAEALARALGEATGLPPETARGVIDRAAPFVFALLKRVVVRHRLEMPQLVQRLAAERPSVVEMIDGRLARALGHADAEEWLVPRRQGRGTILAAWGRPAPEAPRPVAPLPPGSSPEPAGAPPAGPAAAPEPAIEPTPAPAALPEPAIEPTPAPDVVPEPTPVAPPPAVAAPAAIEADDIPVLEPQRLVPPPELPAPEVRDARTLAARAQHAIPVDDAAPVTPAEPPRRRLAPIVLALAAVLGAAGLAAVVIRHFAGVPDAPAGRGDSATSSLPAEVPSFPGRPDEARAPGAGDTAAPRPPWAAATAPADVPAGAPPVPPAASPSAAPPPPGAPPASPETSTPGTTAATTPGTTTAPAPSPPPEPARGEIEAQASDAALARLRELVSGAPGRREAVVLDRVGFASDSDETDARGQAQIAALARLLQAFPRARVRLEGHSDSIGEETVNVRVARGRAVAVRAELVRLGIEARRIEVAGFGSARPIARGDTEAARARNRRVEVRVIAP